VLLQEACGSVDELIERGLDPRAEDVVSCVLAAHRFVRDIERYRGPLVEEIENYLQVSSEASA
jgi:hypothetical protein